MKKSKIVFILLNLIIIIISFLNQTKKINAAVNSSTNYSSNVNFNVSNSTQILIELNSCFNITAFSGTANETYNHNSLNVKGYTTPTGYSYSLYLLDETDDDDYRTYFRLEIYSKDNILYLSTSTLNYSWSGTYSINLNLTINYYSSDTTPPTILGASNGFWYGNSRQIYYEDNVGVTTATYSFNGSTAKTFSSGTTFVNEGQYLIKCTDASGNSTSMYFYIDLNAPTIVAPTTLIVSAGTKISQTEIMSNVTITDSMSTPTIYIVDNYSANYKKSGSYTFIINASDKLRTSSKTITIKVLDEKAPIVYMGNNLMVDINKSISEQALINVLAEINCVEYPRIKLLSTDYFSNNSFGIHEVIYQIDSIKHSTNIEVINYKNTTEKKKNFLIRFLNKIKNSILNLFRKWW